jgi:hypothetical protein
MRSRFTSQFGAPSRAALFIDAVVAIITSMLATVFVFAAMLPQAGSALVG